MNRAARLIGAVSLSLLAALGAVAVASAHPLGNYTVNRAVTVRIGPSEIALRYVVDMAEIPAFSELQAMDTNGDGTPDATEQARYAAAACAVALRALAVRLDGRLLPIIPSSAPRLTLPAGAGGLPTLRLVCGLRAPLPAGTKAGIVSVADSTDDGHVGWREVTVSAAAGVSLAGSDVPSVSRSAELTRYPVDALQTPPDVRGGQATFQLAAGTAGTGNVESTEAPASRGTANDPLAGLVGGELTPGVVLLAVLVATGLGAAHAVSPGHGKTLVAAYLIGSSGSRRHAATLGLTVAVTHTAGVFMLGAITLLAGQFLVPERVIGWLTIGSGFLVVALGAGLVWRATRSSAAASAHQHPHPHDPGPHGHEPGHQHAPALRARNVVALGLAGGMVPSASALIVLLVAISTGRLVFGLGLIVAFGLGMAAVLGGLAVITTMVRGAVTASGGLASHPAVRRTAAALPLVSGLAVLGVGLAATLGAIARFA